MRFSSHECAAQYEYGDRPRHAPLNGYRKELHFDSKSLTDVRVLLRVENEQLLAPRLPVLLNIAIVHTGGGNFYPEPTVSQQNVPHYTLEILASVGDGALKPIPGVVNWRQYESDEDAPQPRRPKMSLIGWKSFWTIRVPVFCNCVGDDAKSPAASGELRLQARYYGVKSDEEGKIVTDRDVFVESKVVAVRIAVPEGIEARALEAVEKLPSPDVLCNPQLLRHGGSGLQSIEKIATSYAGTAYAAYAKFALANSLLWANATQLKPPESSDVQRGIELIEEALSDPRFVLDEEAHELLWQAEINQEKITPPAFHLLREFPAIQRQAGAYGL
jgi:hypothetical protein